MPEVLMELLGPTNERDRKDAFIKMKNGVGQTTNSPQAPPEAVSQIRPFSAP